MEVPGKRIETDDDLACRDNLCEMCEVDNINTYANGFCNECEQYMCNACFRQHIKAALCRHHTLQETTASSEKCERSNGSAIKCKQHETETVRYYCRTHETVGCGDCLVSKHSGCQTEFIKDLSEDFQQNEDYTTFMRKLETLMSQRKEFQKQIQEKKRYNKGMLDKALRDIKQFRFDINKYLDQAETEITCQVQNVMEENETVLTKLENACTVLLTEFDEIKNMLNAELYRDNVLFIHLVEYKTKFPEKQKSILDMKSKSMKKYEFACDQQLCGLITSAKKLGTLEISTLTVFTQTTDQAKESMRQQCASVDDDGGHMREETRRVNVEDRHQRDTSEKETDHTTSEKEYDQTTGNSEYVKPATSIPSEESVRNIGGHTSIASEKESAYNTIETANEKESDSVMKQLYKGMTKWFLGGGALVEVGDRVKHNTYADWCGNGTVIAVHEDSMVTVKWDRTGHSGYCRVGEEVNDVTLI